MRPIALVVSAAAFAVTVAAAAACSRGGEGAPSAGPAAQADQTASAANASGRIPSARETDALVLGERVTSPIVPLAEITRNPGRYENRVVATTGKVTAVCQEMGCWMEIQDTSGRAHVRMHGHTFFVPKTAAGHMARVQARVLHGDQEECKESPAPPSTVAKIELDATGVELD